jgi:FtsP/CotA-like multicopper oxidase with cupredoxin domain
MVMRYLPLLLLCAAIGTRAAPAPSAAGSQAAPLDHSTMDHSAMGHGAVAPTDKDAAPPDHAAMGHDMPAMEGMDHGDMGHAMVFDQRGMAMNSNTDQLPRGCTAISRDYDFTVRAGTQYAQAFPGNIFGLSQHSFEVEPCSRINVTFINDDAVRHQFMVHGLPRYLYPQGMFHLEAVGGATMKGSLIMPGDDRTYLVHCDIAQHMEKGMKGQIKVGRGSADLTSIPGTSALFRPDSYQSLQRQALAVALGMALVLAGWLLWRRRRR